MMLKSLRSASRPLARTQRLLKNCPAIIGPHVNGAQLVKLNYVVTADYHDGGGNSASSNDDPNERSKKLACSSTIFLQDGLSIRELPILVQTAGTSDHSDFSVDAGTCRPTAAVRSPPDDADRGTLTAKYDAVVEIAAVQDGLKNCNSLSEIFELLEVIPVEEVTPQVATFALHRIATLQNDLNSVMSKPSNRSVSADHAGVSGLMDTFAWRAVLDRLVSTICLTKSARVLLEGLEAANLVRKFTQAVDANTSDYTTLAVDRLVREIMAIVAKGQMSIDDACELARTLNSIGTSPKEIDNLWSSFVDKSNSIDETNVAAVFETLPLFRNSGKLVLGLLQKRMYDFWWKLKASDVIVILNALQSFQFVSNSFLTLFTKWISLSVHTLSESEVSKMVASLRSLDHYDANIGRSLERYVKARIRNNSIGLDDPELVANICDFCVHFRYSSIVILDALAIWFHAMRHLMSAEQIFRVARTFGILNHVPATGRQFFAALEDSIDSRFVMFKPEHLVELLLTCTHIQRYPLNFVRRMLSPFFLDRLNDITDETRRYRATMYLRLLDSAMTLECSHYDGPMVHCRIDRTLQRDGRLYRIHSWMDDDFADVLGGREMFATVERLPKVPLADIYICDFLFNLDQNDSPVPFYKKGGFSKRKAVIVHLPDDYIMDGRCLVGKQAARVRHVQRLGYEVVQMDYLELENMKKRQSTERLDYLRNKLLVRV